MTSNNQSTGDRRSARDDLTLLVRENATDPASLGRCTALGDALLRELGVKQPVSAGARLLLVQRVLSDVTAQARQRALQAIDDYPPQEAGDREDCQVAAAGELIGLTDAADFAVLTTRRSKQLGVNWSDLERRKDNRGKQASRQLRAAFWLGAESARTAAPDRHGPELLDALASNIVVHAHTNQAALRAFLAETTETSAEDSSADTTPENQAAGSTRRKRVAIGGGAGLVMAGAIVTGVFLLNAGDDPSAKPGPTPSSPSSTTPTGATRLTDVGQCDVLPPDSPLARQLLASRRAIIDGRCDKAPAAPVGSYAMPSQSGTKREPLKTGDVIEDICLVDTSASLRDLAEHSSSLWVRFRSKQGGVAYVPAIWVQGEDGARYC